MAAVRGVVSRGKGAPVTLEEIVVPAPGPGEAVVAIKACGVCHTDLHYREGGINDDFPFLLGHEAAGVVESVGPDGVDGVAPGDFVVLNWRAVCGECRACRRGRPWYCFATHNATQKMTLADGTPVVPGVGHRRVCGQDAGGGGAVHQGRPAGPARGGRAPGLRRHGRPRRGHVHRATWGSATRWPCSGAAGWAAPPSPAPSWPAPRPSSPSTSIPTSSKAAKKFGATHTVDASSTDPVEAVRGLTDGNGADVCIEAVGNPKVMEQAFYARDLAGTLVQVGVPTPDMRIELPMIEFFGRGGALKPSWYGDCLPTRDFPKLVDLYLAGRLDLDLFVTETIGLDEVEKAFDRMQRGEVLRSVVVL